MKLETNYVWPFTRARKLKVKMMLFGLNQKSPVENFTYVSRGVMFCYRIKSKITPIGFFKCHMKLTTYLF